MKSSMRGTTSRNAITLIQAAAMCPTCLPDRSSLASEAKRVRRSSSGLRVAVSVAVMTVADVLVGMCEHFVLVVV